MLTHVDQYIQQILRYPESYNQFSNEFKNMHPETDEQLVDLLNNMAQKREKSIFQFEGTLSFSRDELNVRNALEKCSQEYLNKRVQVLKNFNKKMSKMINLIDFSASNSNYRLKNIYAQTSVNVFWEIKSDLFEKNLTSENDSNKNHKVKLNRMKANRFIQRGGCDHTGEFTVFGQLFQFVKSKSLEIFKVKKDQNPFNVSFIGEASIDIGGPYRETISQICVELQSSAIPLLIPSPNQKNESGQFREKWIINPSANSIIHFQMFEMLGAIMGCAIRTKNFLNLDLPSIFWKYLVDVQVTRKDLENIDRYTIQCLDDILNIHKKGITIDTFNQLIQEKFVTCLSDGSEIQLLHNGQTIDVTFDRRTEYVQLVEKIRLNESSQQTKALRQGLLKIVPEGLINLLTWRELETLVCGKPVLDIELLKMNTIYKQCSISHPVIEFFWKALTNFTTEERSMYLRFIWGRSRLPLQSKDFDMKHSVEIIEKSNIDPDKMLPIAHTCFFSIEIPKYSTYEILRDKLKYAITNCQAIDTDGRAYDIWDDDD